MVMFRPPQGSPLTSRNMDVIRLWAQGLRNQGAAKALGLSPITIKKHGEAIFSRIGVNTQCGVVGACFRAGLLDDLPRPTRNACPMHERCSQILPYLALGLTDREIGARLHLSEDTVKTYTKQLFKALGAQNRPHAVTLGYQHNLIKEI